MMSPAVMMIEIALERMVKPDYLPEWLKESQRKELKSAGDTRVQKIGATGLSEDFVLGYELGLATARTVLAMSPALTLKGIKPEDVL